jgi:hypothetical protein
MHIVVLGGLERREPEIATAAARHSRPALPLRTCSQSSFSAFIDSIRPQATSLATGTV